VAACQWRWVQHADLAGGRALLLAAAPVVEGLSYSDCCPLLF